MTETKSLPNTAHKSGPLLSPREEAERFAVAAQSLLERARQDPEYARQILQDIGYYDMMEQSGESDTPANGVHENGSSNGVDSVTVRASETL